MEKIKDIYRGVTLVVIIAFISLFLGQKVPSVGAGGFGIIIGILIASLLGVKEEFQAGIKFSSKTILHISIVLLGISINLKDIMKTGLESLPVIITGVLISFLVSNIIGKMFGVDYKIRNLIGGGTGICGGSAIAAISSVINPKEEEISCSLSIIFLFNVIAVFIFPSIGHFLNMSQHSFGIFSGSAINDTSSVVAAGYIYGNEAGKFATTVKLTRTMSIVPVVLVFSFLSAKGKEKNHKIKDIIPWFILCFIFMSFFRTIIDFFPKLSELKILIKSLSEIGKFFIVMAITAIGLQTDFKNLSFAIIKPIILGFITWLFVIFSTFGMQLFLKIN